ncbi:hypothetical protein P152DRAFT_460726 [Eremomyces bilateralis CBS 781.70]|uniref:YCII-related domain-containing protein n=1 Tax=Eremomyces bilateralis CBS 781.70 TaxID=1392243 RepID=A0A6G1FWV3_9PEZI|nr:uncharacterized protein P152DRAFT_460726 [Eremomyces bilateralis CBS 781.70]KAF1810218.1 hypothetical protein P152DRAFT_460726 [Eremomyces bilateralis CBS 781.70]
MASSSNASANNEWLVILPDQENALERRLEVRPKHFAGLKPGIESGFWLMGGALLSSHPPPDSKDPPPMVGSALLARAATQEELLEKLKADPYTVGQVWDWNKVQIYPFKSAIRSGM